MSEKFELSPNQKALWASLTNQLPESCYYDFCLEIPAEISEAQLKPALRSVLEKHRILASGLWKDSSNFFPTQFVRENAGVDFFQLEQEASLEAFGKLACQQFAYAYDPTHDHSLRCCYGKLDTGQTCLYVRIFALWTDHYGCYYFVKELNAFLNGAAPASDDDDSEMIEYINYASWQNQTVADQEGSVFWKNYSYNVNHYVLPFGKKQSASTYHVAKKQVLSLDQKLLQQQMGESGLSTEQFLLAAFARYVKGFDSNAITIGYVPFKPAYEELELTLGAVAKTVPLNIEAEIPVHELNRELAARLEELLEWSDYFEGASGKLNYCFEYVPVSAQNTGGPCKLLYSEPVGGMFDLKLVCTDNNGSVGITLLYDTTVFTDHEAALITAQLRGLLEGNQQPSEMDLKIIAEANATAKPVPNDWSVLQQIESFVQHKPEATALVFEGSSITYAELGQLSDKIARLLQQHYGIQAGDAIALAVERSDWMVIALLGILKSGAFYVPVDTDLPHDRIQFMLKDASCKIVLHGDSFQCKDLEAQTVHLNELQHIPEATTEIQLLPHVNTIAYCIYTSGTTGLPKGCLLTHANLNHYIHWANQHYYEQSQAPANWALITSIAFDLTITSIFSCLTMGGQLWIGSGKKDVGELLESCLSESATNTLKLTPSHLVVLNELNLDATNIRCMILGGEQVQQKQVKQFLEKHPNAQIFNEYGPTEATVGCVVEELLVDTEDVLIGKPIENMIARIVRPDGSLCLVGEAGELWLSGAGIAKGYLGREELNTTKFVSDQEGRWYKTGDLARWTAEGKMDYLGRIDEQLKIRGYRIEPGEIEHQLTAVPSVNAAVVLARPNNFGEPVLVAYYTAETKLQPTELQTTLAKGLPGYMIPAHFIYLKAFPLTTNGKVDKRALPDPETAVEIKKEPYVAPGSPKEQAVTSAYETVLRTEQVGVLDNFFHLGGDSIKAIQIVSELRKSGYTTSIEKVLLSPTPSQLALQLSSTTNIENTGPVTGNVLLGPIQKKLLREEQVRSLNYNQAVFLQTTGAIDPQLLEKCLDQLLRHHDALRMQFEWKEHGWEQTCLADIKTSSVLVHFSPENGASFEEACEALQQSILPQSSPLFRVLLDTTGNRVLLVAHHLIVDGVSWRIILEDLNALYAGLQHGHEVELPPKSASFQEWQQVLEKHSGSDAVLAENSYWSKVAEEAFAFPVMDPTATNRICDSFSDGFELDEQLTERFLSKCYTAYRTEAEMLLITAMIRSFGQSFSLEGLTVMLEGHGRQTLSDTIDVSRTVGWFTSLYPVNFSLGEEPLAATLIRVKETLKRIPEKGFAYGLLEAGNESLSVKAPLTFNYLGEIAASEAENASFFQLSGEPHGNSVSPFWERSGLLDVTAVVVHKKLTVRVTAAGLQIDPAAVRATTASFSQQLNELIELLHLETAEHITPSDLTCNELEPAAVLELNAENDLEDVYTLSPLQEGMYYHWKLTPGSGVYVNQIAYTRRAQLTSAQVEKALLRLMERHPVLRTGFTTDYLGKVLQVVRKKVQPDFQFIDNRESMSSRGQLLNEDCSGAFELDAKTLLRLNLVQMAEEEYLFVWCFHHIILDGWCTGILISDFEQYLAAELHGAKVQLPAVRPFSDYIKWLNKRNHSTATDYWNNFLEGYDNAVSVPYQQVKNLQESMQSVVESCTIEGQSYEQFTHLCHRLSITQNSFLQTVWGYLLALYNGSDDVVFGSVVSGRSNDLEGIDKMVGMFINTIPVRCVFEEGKTIEQLLLGIHHKAIESTPYHYQNLADVQSLSEQGMHLINHIMVFENFAVSEQTLSAESTAISDLQFTDRTNYPFNLVIIPAENTLKIEFRYDAGRFDSAGIRHLASEFLYLIDAFSRNPEKMPSELPYWPDNVSGSLPQLVDVAWPEDKTIIDCIQDQLPANRNAIAISSEGKNLTYGEVDILSNALAWYLIKEKSVVVEDLVSICLDRNEWVVISMLAILKAGAAYVPVDPLYPADRIAFIQKDSGCKAMIDGAFIADFLTVQSGFPQECPDVAISPSAAAYVIYTSGTTGLPKGVVVEHRNVVRLFFSDHSLFDFRQQDVWTMFHSYCFDFSVWEMYGALFYGGRLVMVPASVSKDIALFAELVVREKVTVLNQTPSVFELLMSYLTENGSSTELRYVIFGGEQLNPGILANWKQSYPECRLINMYGITETTVHVTFKELTGNDIQSNVSNIGTPIPTLGCFVRDKYGREVPPGIPGELYVAGAGVARGYLHRDELTRERFTSLNGARVYRSGDLVRKNHSGELEYIGRNDDQVKIRGYRIETAEIEKMLLGHSKVREVRVLVKGEPKNRQLCAYFSSDAGTDEQLPASLRSFLVAKLPDYMIPAHFIQIDRIPVTVNGKLDRSKLPSPETRKAPEPLQTALEQQLGSCWAGLLGLEVNQIGRDSNFFDLGANSLTVMRLTLELKSDFDCEIAISEIFGRQTVKELAEYIENHRWLSGQGEGNVNLTELEI